MRMLCGCPRGQLQAVEGAWLTFQLALRARYLSLTPPFRNPASATDHVDTNCAGLQGAGVSCPFNAVIVVLYWC